MNLQQISIKGDKSVWGVIFLLSFFSICIVYSATSALAFKERGGFQEYYLVKQICIFIFGWIIVYGAHRMKYTRYNNLSVIFYFISLILLFVTLVAGSKINGGARWLPMPGGLSLQTSDVAKLALFMLLARQLSKYQNQITDRNLVLKQIYIPAMLVVVLIMPANLSTALMLTATTFLLMFVGRVKMLHMLQFGLATLLLLVMLFFVFKVTGFGRAKTWESRITSFLNKDKNPETQEEKDKQFQSLQAEIAIANGRFFGKGFGHSVQKNILPHPYSDMVTPIIIEEGGILTFSFIVFLYLFLLHRSIVIFKKCPYAYGGFLAIGLSITLVIQAFLNMAVGVGIFPVTGLTLPLISMGGTSVWFTSLTLGIILSVSRFVEEEQKQ